MRYRDHRGSLSESLKTEINISSKDELIDHLNKEYSYGHPVEYIEFHYVGFDDRINWNTYYVVVKLAGEEQQFVAGMSDGKLD